MWELSDIPYERALARVRRLRGVLRQSYEMCWHGHWRSVPKQHLDMLCKMRLMKSRSVLRTYWPGVHIIPSNMVDKVVPVRRGVVAEYHYTLTTSAYVAGLQEGLVVDHGAYRPQTCVSAAPKRRRIAKRTLTKAPKRRTGGFYLSPY